MNRVKSQRTFLWLLAALLILGIAHLPADDLSATPSSAPPASSPTTDPAQVSFHLRQVLVQPQFHESDNQPLNTRFEDWLSQWFNRLGKGIGDFKYASSMPAFESLLMTVLVVFSIGGIIYILVRLTRRRDRMEAEGTSEAPGQNLFQPPESYEEEITRAIEGEDWHGAWLASWRQFLSRLERRSLVEADRTQTNREYLAQLNGKALPAAATTLLSSMVDTYDRFIYGRRTIDKSEWNSFHRQIDEAALLLHLSDGKATRRAEGAS